MVHGNGPQIGLLALQAAAYTAVSPYPLDILGAESQGMIGYLIQSALRNVSTRSCVTLLTQVMVDEQTLELKHADKPIGPVYSKAEAQQVAMNNHWIMHPDGQGYRRVVASPTPISVCEINIVESLLAQGITVIAGGGGGIPCIKNQSGHQGVEAVVDKDMTAALCGIELNADALIILSDIEGVYQNWGTDRAAVMPEIKARVINSQDFAEGTMAPKIKAAQEFVVQRNKLAFIGHLQQLNQIMAGSSGTKIC